MKKRIFTRRDFLTTVAAGAGTIMIGENLFNIPVPAGSSKIDPFRIVPLGKTGIKTTLIGMGTGFNGYNRSSSITRAEKGTAEKLIRYAYEKGIRYFDCADLYGTHIPLKTALKDYPRNSYTIGTKIWVSSGGIPEADRPDSDVVVERFRKELDTDYIDLVQIHCMTDTDWTDKQKKQMDILENLKARKIIRAHGVSVHSLDAMKAAAESQWVDVVHVRINPYGEAMDKKDPAEVVPVIEKIHKSGKGVIGMKLIGNGKFRNDSEKINKSLKYVLGLGSVDVVIVGFDLPEHIDNYTERMISALTGIQNEMATKKI